MNIFKKHFDNEKKYIDRVNKFFKYQDDNNCKRVYEEIIKMLERTK